MISYGKGPQTLVHNPLLIHGALAAGLCRDQRPEPCCLLPGESRRTESELGMHSPETRLHLPTLFLARSELDRHSLLAELCMPSLLRTAVTCAYTAEMVCGQIDFHGIGLRSEKCWGPQCLMGQERGLSYCWIIGTGKENP